MTDQPTATVPTFLLPEHERHLMEQRSHEWQLQAFDELTQTWVAMPHTMTVEDWCYRFEGELQPANPDPDDWQPLGLFTESRLVPPDGADISILYRPISPAALTVQDTLSISWNVHFDTTGRNRT